MIWLVITLLITAADQAAKYLIAANAEIGETLFSRFP